MVLGTIQEDVIRRSNFVRWILRENLNCYKKFLEEVSWQNCWCRNSFNQGLCQDVKLVFKIDGKVDLIQDEETIH